MQCPQRVTPNYPRHKQCGMTFCTCDVTLSKMYAIDITELTSVWLLQASPLAVYRLALSVPRLTHK